MRSSVVTVFQPPLRSVHVPSALMVTTSTACSLTANAVIAAPVQSGVVLQRLASLLGAGACQRSAGPFEIVEVSCVLLSSLLSVTTRGGRLGASMTLPSSS